MSPSDIKALLNWAQRLDEHRTGERLADLETIAWSLREIAERYKS